MSTTTRRLIVGFILLSITSLLLIGPMPSPVGSDSSGARRLALSLGQEFDPSCCDTQASVTPISPTSNDAIQVTAYGNWQGSCAPVYQSHEIVGNVIRVDAMSNYLPVCEPVIMPWHLAADVGTLPIGSYEIHLYILDFRTQTTTLCATATFDVAPPLLITAVYYDTYLTDEPDEAFRLMNTSGATMDLSGWTVTDGPSEGTITLQGSLAPGESIWIARQADDFALEFGFAADYEYEADTDPSVPNLSTSGTFALANSGDQVVVQDDGAAIIDSVVYEDGDPDGTGWLGPGIWPYGGDTVGDEAFARQEQAIEAFGKEGQVLYRKLDQGTGLPVPDTDTAADWAQATDDNINGKKIQYPGWDLERYFIPPTFAEPATLTYAVAPDHIYETVVSEINQATSSILYEGYTFKNAHLAEAIVARMTADPGMTVRILLEGEPVGGITDQEKWICQQIENAGGSVYFMHTDNDADIHDRYNYQHGKWMIIDGQTLLTGSENLNYSSMPADDKADGTSGNRGVWLITDAPGAVAHALDVFEHDLDPANHRDLARWNAADPVYGAPPAGFTPDYASGGSAYPIQFPTPLTTQGTFAMEMVQSPENSLRDSDSLLGMVARAGAGDTVLVQQLYEYTYWGATGSNPTDDPNLRLEAYIAAAERGAKVRLLLDSVFDDPGDPRGNTATCAYANGIALDQGLDLACKVGDPTGNGIHNKMVLVLDGEQGYVHTGSINGSENSSKNNREFAVQVQAREAYDYLSGVFWHDWGGMAHYLPVVLRSYPTPTPTAGCAIMCTPPACEPDEVYYCPATCPCGCGTECATRTPVPEAEVQPVRSRGPAPLALLGVSMGVMGYAGLAMGVRRR